MADQSTVMCQFDATTLQCVRCGYQAKKFKTFRVCRTIPEIAREISRHSSTQRISLPPLRIGSAVSSALSTIGITPNFAKAIIGKDCGCDRRKAWLDSFGAALSSTISGAANAVLNAVIPHPVSDDEVADIAQGIHDSPLTNAGLKGLTVSRSMFPPGEQRGLEAS